MGFLHKIWDETLAGPAPDSGLGKLRKYNSLASGFAPTAPPPPLHGHDGSHVGPVSRSITVLRPYRNLSVSVESPSDPSSPVGSSGPNSPFSPSSPGGNVKKLTRRKSTSGAARRDEVWIMLTAMDR